VDKVHKELKVQVLELKVHKEPKVDKGHKEPKEQVQEPKVHKVLKGDKELRGLKVIMLVL
jgi:hypothetical protein